MSGGRISYAGGVRARFVYMGAAVFLSLFGLVMIYSASSITASVKEGSAWHFFVRQLIFIGLGAAIAFVVSRIDYRILKSKAMVLWGAGIALLGAALVFGVIRGGARRWIPLGLFNLQPSELAKIACVIAVAALAVEWMRGRTETSRFMGAVAVITGVPTVLIIAQPDLGTTLTLIVAVAMVLILAGISWRWVGLGVVAGTALVALAIALEPYRVRRVLAFLDPWADPQGKGYQTVQALLAFGTGGIDGVGLGLSRQKFFYLPEAHTDFILAIIGEEVGLIGTLAVVVAMAVFVWAGFRIAIGARDPFGRLVAGGISGMLGFQAALNMFAVTGLIPVTGKPLPFVSYGGSSMLVTMICVGLVLSVSRFGAHSPRAVRSAPREKEAAREGRDERWRDSGSRVSGTRGGGRARRRA